MSAAGSPSEASAALDPLPTTTTTTTTATTSTTAAATTTTTTASALSSIAPSSSRLLVIVTGASRGFGQCCAQAIAEVFSPVYAHVHFVLTARQLKGLKETEHLLHHILPQRCSTALWIGDLSVPAEADALITKMLEGIDPKDYGLALLVQNAGTLGDLSKHVRDYNSMADLQAFFTINVSSFLLLTARFSKLFHGHRAAVVNVSSLLAVQAFAGWGCYAAAKAARDHAMRVLAAEGMRTLNYAPGPLATDMQAEVRATLVDEAMRRRFAEMAEQDQLVKPGDSARRMARLLLADTFENGAHVDYYDLS